MGGVMQAPSGPTEDPTKGFTVGGWVMLYFDQEFGEELNRLFSENSISCSAACTHLHGVVLDRVLIQLRVGEAQRHIADTSSRQTDDGALRVQRVEFPREQAQSLMQAVSLSSRLLDVSQPVEHPFTSDCARRDPPDQMLDRVDPIS
jgi:hypothetical protein